MWYYFNALTIYRPTVVLYLSGRTTRGGNFQVDFDRAFAFAFPPLLLLRTGVTRAARGRSDFREVGGGGVCGGKERRREGGKPRVAAAAMMVVVEPLSGRADRSRQLISSDRDGVLL